MSLTTDSPPAAPLTVKQDSLRLRLLRLDIDEIEVLVERLPNGATTEDVERAYYLLDRRASPSIGRAKVSQPGVHFVTETLQTFTVKHRPVAVLIITRIR